MSKSVFISRDLDDDSPFRGMLEARGIQVTGTSFLTIQPHPFDVVPSSNWIFFYSKNSVNHFFSQLSKTQKEALPQQIATIGPGTARSLVKWGIKPTFIGNGDVIKTAEMFAEIALGQIVLFPRAQNSRRSVQAELDDEIQSIDLIVYKNGIVDNPQKRDDDILVFTSPLNAEAYFLHHKLNVGQLIVAIGGTTAMKLTELGIDQFAIAEYPSEESLAQTVFSFFSI